MPTKAMSGSLRVLAAAASVFFVMASAAEKQEDMGTVIGIDLGTTYSW